MKVNSYWLIGVEQRIYASVNYAIFGSDNGFSSIRYQAIIWTTNGILLTGHQWLFR